MENLQYVSWRRRTGLHFTRRTVFAAVCNFFLLATIAPKESLADLANETEVLIAMKAAWGNPVDLDVWSLDKPTCEWGSVICDELNSTVTGIRFRPRQVTLDSPIPAIIGELTNLTLINMDSCSLTGEIPSSMGSLKNLQFLVLSSNALNGSIPGALGNLPSLQSLSLDQNNLSGVLPDELSQLKQLKYLYLGINQDLTGTLPAWMGDFSELEELSLSNSNFQGSIPPELGNLTNLTTLSMLSAGLSGILPAELGKMTNLQTLELSGAFTGNIPSSYRNLRNLQSFTCNPCFLNGSVPSWFGSIVNLTEIDLGNNDLVGPIPDELGNSKVLSKLVLSNNALNGTIPEALSNITSLLVLDLDGNRLSGEIPAGILSLPNIEALSLQGNCLQGSQPQLNSNNTIDVSGNCFNGIQTCKCVNNSAPFPPISKSGSSNLTIYIAVGVVVGSLIGLLAIIVIIWRCRLRSKRPNRLKYGSIRCYRLSEVRAATKNFATEVGTGGFAVVYKAEFKDGTVAAVKRFDVRKRQGKELVESFQQEVDLLSRLNHRFLVNILGFCQEAGEHLLLSEFMDKGSLYDHLHGKYSNVSLTWEERVKILICVAFGIEYLHYGSDPPTMHRDIKSANILLSSDGIAKIADFGLGKQTVIDTENETRYGSEPPRPEPTELRGSRGYMDPEYLSTSVLSPKSDIYSYGVVLLELVTGRRSLVNSTPLAIWVREVADAEDTTELLRVVDPRLGGNFVEEELLAVENLARDCTESESHLRPTIREVLQRLKQSFERQSRLVNPSLRNSSTADVSGLQSIISTSGDVRDLGSQDMTVNYYSQSEILPRD